MFIKCPRCNKVNNKEAPFCSECNFGLMEDPLAYQEKVDNFIQLLRSPDRNLRLNAIKNLATLKPDESIAPLAKIMKGEQDLELRTEAINALKGFKEEDVAKFFTEAYKEEAVPELRISIVKAAGEFKTREAINLLLMALEDSFADIEEYAITALGDKKDRKTLEPLFNIVKNKKSLFIEDARASIKKIEPDFLSLWDEEQENLKKKAARNRLIALIAAVLAGLICMVFILKHFADENSLQRIDLRLKEGQKYFQEGNLEKAQEVFDDIIFRAPEEAYPHYGLGLIYLNKGENKKAFNEMAKAIELDKDNPEYIVGYGRAQIVNGNYLSAVNKIQEAIDLNKKTPEAYLYMGDAYYKLNNKGDAMDYYNYCVSNFPETPAGKEAAERIKNFNNPTEENSN